MAAKDKIEVLMSNLDEILLKLNDDECSLDESFRLYESGMKLVGEINKKIEKIESSVETVESRYELNRSSED